jgi:hypothetical protein
MAWPLTAVHDQGIELYLGSTWTDITSYIYSRDAITGSRGRSGEGGTVSPARLAVTLDNRDYRFSPRVPTGAYYGQIGRNTKIRHWVRAGTPRLRIPTAGDQFFTADSAGISVTGDIDLRADVTLPTWRPETSSIVGVIKGSSYSLFIDTDGSLWIAWYAGAVYRTMGSTRPVPGATTGRKAVRATLDVNNGAAGRTATFYYSDDDTMDGTWVQFDTATTSGTTSIDNTTDTLGAYLSHPGEINEIRVYDGIAGTKRASPKFTAQASGTTSFADAEGNTWDDAGTAALDNKHYRFTGDVAAWNPRQDTTGTDLYTVLDCAGPLRRLDQGSTPVASALRRGVPALPDLRAYWPLEDGESSSEAEAGLDGVSPGRYVGAPQRAAYSGFVASAPVVQPGTGRIYLPIPAYTNTDEFQVRFVLHLPPGGIATGTTLLRIKTNSSLGWIDWIYNSGDSMTLKTYRSNGVLSLTTTGFDITSQITDQDIRVSLEFAKNGTGVDLTQTILPIGESSGVTYTETNASITLGAATSIYINPDGIDLGDLAIGHITIEDVTTGVFDAANSLERAYQGEEAHARIDRLCTENGVTARVYGLGESAEVLGYQTRSDLLTLLREAEAADGGVLVEARDADALTYRTRESIARQPARHTIDYSAANLQRFEPAEDDARTRNKVTVTRTGGSSATVEDTDSTLSTATVGIYDDSATVSLYSDGQAVHQAGWKVRLGTVDEVRIPVVAVNLAHPDYATDNTALRTVLSLDCGDRLVITNPPSWLPPEQLDLVITGYTERTAQYEHTLEFACAPALPYRAAVYDGHPTQGRTRYANDATTVNGAHNSTTTSLSVAFTSGPVWTHTDGDYTIMVAGETMTVTAVAGSSSPQTLTVTRSVNGVVKAQSSGTAVRLAEPSYYPPGTSTVTEGVPFAAMDHALPLPVAETGNGVNTITSTSFAALPSYPCTAQILNPNPDQAMVCLVGYGAWASASTNDVRLALRITRAGQQYLAAGIGSDGPVGYGEIPAVLVSSLTGIHARTSVLLDPSPYPYVFEVYAMRAAAAGTQDARYACLRIVPIRYSGYQA